jgi:hypothetical protein
VDVTACDRDLTFSVQPAEPEDDPVDSFVETLADAWKREPQAL